MTNRVNAHLKRAHDLLKQSSKAFGAPRLSIRPIKQISIYLDGVSRQDYDEMMEKWEKNSTIQSVRDSIQHYLQYSYERNPRMRNNTWTLTMAYGGVDGNAFLSMPQAVVDFEYNVDDVLSNWSNAHLRERIALYPKYRALQTRLNDEEGIKLVTNAVNNALARSGDDWLQNIKVTQVFENSSPPIEGMLDHWHDRRYDIVRNHNRTYRQNE